MELRSAGPEEADARPANRLRFVVCGAAGDGKTALLDRLLRDSRDPPPPSADGLQAERDTAVDVVYRCFETGRRRFIAADAPGHEQYTRDMATGASTADLAVILADARRGALTQTRRHGYVASLMGVRQAILAIYKMDLAGYAQAAFEAVAEDYAAFARNLGIEEVRAVALSALTGDNVVAARGAMPWYADPTLMEALEAATPRRNEADGPFPCRCSGRTARQSAVSAASLPRAGSNAAWRSRSSRRAGGGRSPAYSARGASCGARSPARRSR